MDTTRHDTIKESNDNYGRLLRIPEGLSALVGVGGTLVAGAILAQAALSKASIGDVSMGAGVTLGTVGVAFIANWISKKAVQNFENQMDEGFNMGDRNAAILVDYMKENMLTDENMEFVRKSGDGGAWIVYDQERKQFLEPMSKYEYQQWSKAKAQEFKNAGKKLTIAEIKDPSVGTLTTDAKMKDKISDMIDGDSFRIDFLEADKSGRMAPPKDEYSQAIYNISENSIDPVALINRDGSASYRKDVLAENTQGMKI